jgi:hypothetical protein
MISSFPRSRLILLGIDLYPFFGIPVENIDGIEALFVGSSSSEDDNLIVLRIIVHGAIRALGWFISSGMNFLPLHSYRIVSPQIIHVIRIYIKLEVPAYPPKKTISSPITQQV